MAPHIIKTLKKTQIRKQRRNDGCYEYLITSRVKVKVNRLYIEYTLLSLPTFIILKFH